MLIRRLTILLLIVGCDSLLLDKEDVYGCTDSNAVNYNADANTDDGSCEYLPFYEFTDFTTINGMDEFGNPTEYIGDGIAGGCLVDNQFIIKDYSYSTTVDSISPNTLIIVTPSDSSLFTYTGDFEVVDIILANLHDSISVAVSYDSIGVSIAFPTQFTLKTAYPNPFKPTTSMNLTVPEAGNVSVQVYNIRGEVVATLQGGYMDANTYTLTWDATEFPDGYYRAIADFGNKQCFFNLHKSN